MKNDCVVLLHGLARTGRSMKKLAASLKTRGYRTVNIDYPSRLHPIETLAETVIPQALELCAEFSPENIHFVTHSLGGILIRCYLKGHTIANLGRIVMLAPPNQGSEVADKLSGFRIYRLINGPAGNQLGTDSQSVPSRLGPTAAEIGVIAGCRSVNLLLSLLIPGPNDGKVSVQRARLEGMSDFLVIPAAHPFIMNCPETFDQVAHFLKHGIFRR
ncbi:MAG: esterase/lipase family protein [Gammaproteobacteria bacterium]